MKKTDLELLSPALLATACGQKPGTDDTTAAPAPTTTVSPANAPAAVRDEKQAGKAADEADVKPSRTVRSVKPSLPTPALGRTGRGGGRSDRQRDSGKVPNQTE